MNWSLDTGQALNAVLNGAGVGVLLGLAWLAAGLALHTGRHRGATSGIGCVTTSTNHVTQRGLATMHTFQGIAMDTWVDIDGTCPIEIEVVGQQAQFQLGHATGSLHLVLNERGLGKLVDALATALAKLRDVDQPAATQN